MTTRQSAGLEQVFAARTTAALADAYATWSNEYDRETAEAGYCLPFMITAWLARYLASGSGPILDAGCGTGLSGPYLQALGYAEIEGLDLSDQMIALARARGAYGEITRAAIGENLPWKDGHFAAFISTGVFTEGHAPASGLQELARVVRPGGFAVFTVRESIFDSGGFAAVFEALAKAGVWRLREESGLFRAFAIHEPDVLVKAYVFEILPR